MRREFRTVGADGIADGGSVWVPLACVTSVLPCADGSVAITWTEHHAGQGFVGGSSSYDTTVSVEGPIHEVVAQVRASYEHAAEQRAASQKHTDDVIARVVRSGMKKL